MIRVAIILAIPIQSWEIQMTTPPRLMLQRLRMAIPVSFPSQVAPSNCIRSSPWTPLEETIEMASTLGMNPLESVIHLVTPP